MPATEDTLEREEETTETTDDEATDGTEEEAVHPPTTRHTPHSPDADGLSFCVHHWAS